MKPLLHALLACALLTGCVPTAWREWRAYHGAPRALGLPDATLTVTDTQATVADAAHTLVFDRGKRTARIDGTLYHLHRAAGRYALPEADAALLREALVPARPLGRAPRLLLDPGHGGGDRGCSVDAHRESAITLAIAQAAAQALAKAGCDVRLTRADDATTLSLTQRVEQAAAFGPDAFVSVHVNSAANPNARGVEVFTLPLPGHDGTAANAKAWPAPLAGQAHLPAATRLALAVQRALAASADDRGVRHAHFKVLRDVPAPSILIETGFLTNAADRDRLTSPAGQQAIGQAIADALLRAFVP